MSGASSCHQGYVDEAKEYLDGAYLGNGEMIPTQAGLSLHLHVSKATLRNWEDQESNTVLTEWREVMDRLRALQEVKVLNGALSKELDSQTSRLILQTNYGYNEKQSIDHTSGGKTIKSFADMYGVSES